MTDMCGLRQVKRGKKEKSRTGDKTLKLVGQSQSSSDKRGVFGATIFLGYVYTTKDAEFSVM